MLEKIIKDYFSFTRKERVAVLVLVLLTITVSLLPYWIPERGDVFDKAGFDTLRLNLQPKEPARSTMTENDHTSESPHYTSGYPKMENSTSTSELFYFDPNTLSPAGWKKLGLSDKTIQTIQNYISKGGRFKTATDISRIYGLHPNQIERLMPYVKIADAHFKTPVYSRASYNDTLFKRTVTMPHNVDVNTADTTDWIALPGIGSKLASRIVRFRERLGGFYSIDQLSEIYGIPDSTFQKLRPRLKMRGSVVTTININTIPAEELKQHPYMKWNIANAIVEYRKQHGIFRSLDDLRKIDLITDEIYRKIVPYLKIE